MAGTKSSSSRTRKYLKTKLVLAIPDISRSYGSVISTHILHTPEVARKIGPVVLVDPVTFLLHLPDVAYNFVSH